jgi:hypothetical protein
MSHLSAPPTEGRPAFGYLRRLPGMDKAAVTLAVGEILTYADLRCFTVAGVHIEHRAADRLSTWRRLVVTCRAEGVTDIVVPSSGHFHGTAERAAFMKAELAVAIGGTVRLADTARVRISREKAARDAF